MKNENGHTLIELIFVIVLIGISFPGLLAFFSNSMIDSVKNEIITQAIVLAQEKMELIVADKHDDEKGIYYIKVSDQYPEENIGQFTRTVTVSDRTIAGIAGIDVIVSVRHSLLQYDYTLNHFFTNQKVY